MGRYVHTDTYYSHMTSTHAIVSEHSGSTFQLTCKLPGDSDTKQSVTYAHCVHSLVTIVKNAPNKPECGETPSNGHSGANIHVPEWSNYSLRHTYTTHSIYI